MAALWTVLRPLAIDSAELLDATQPPAHTILHVGYSSEIFIDVDLNDALAATEVWLDKIFEEFGSDDFTGTETQVLHGTDRIVEAVEAEEVDVLAITPVEYLELRDVIDIVPAFVSSVFGSRSFEEVLLVRHDAAFDSVVDLHGRRAVVERAGRGVIPVLWLDMLVQQASGGTSQDFFSSVQTAPNVSKAVLPVFFGQADVCVVPYSSFETMVELNPQLGRELVVIARSPPFSNGLLCVRRAFYEMLWPQLNEVMGTMHEKPRDGGLLSSRKE